MPIKGKLKFEIIIDAVPTEVTINKISWANFIVDCDGHTILVSLRPRMWAKLMDAGKNFPQFKAQITGKSDATRDGHIHLNDPFLQVFEVKPTPPKEPPPDE